MYKHPCVRCKAQYEDEDPEPYYCATCKRAVKALAEELDKRPRVVERPMSMLQMYDNAPKVRGFVSPRDLGL